MDNGMLSQEEIDALLRGESSFDSPPLSLRREITEVEKDAIGEIANISMGTAATTLSTLLGKKVEITTPKVQVIHKDELSAEHPLPFVTIDVQYLDGLHGNSLLIIKQKDAAVIVDLMMGGSGTGIASELSELHLSAIGEAMNQMMGSAATSLSTVLNERIDISPPNIHLINFAQERIDDKVSGVADYLVKVSFRMVIGSLVDSEMMQLIPIEVATSMVNKIMGEMGQSPTSELAPAPQLVAEVNNNHDTHGEKVNNRQYSDSNQQKSKTVAVKPAQFAPLTPQQTHRELGNIDLLLDIPLQLSVELGKARKTIKEILELASGSVIELDKLAGEPVDILVNGKLIAKGEVVVIDENFGVRVTDIVSPMERVNNIKY
ncbi:MAG: flagellar motor switch phosphatase FliY [Clostridia bacterium]|nr:flagellar motor switch phosphatase FliY [Clostridia bacterium]